MPSEATVIGANESERRRWNNERWTASWTKREKLTAALTPYLLRAAAPQPDERILDIGCGGGGTSIAVAAAVGPSGMVVGADVSGPLTNLARRRAVAAEVSNVSFLVLDAQSAHIAGGPFDVAISQLGVMFFDEPVKAFANIRVHLRPGARLVFVCWQVAERNPWHVGTALRSLVGPTPLPAPGKSPAGPFSLGDPVHTSALLGAAGFTEISHTAHDVINEAPASAVVDDSLLDVLGVLPENLAQARAVVTDHLARFRLADDLHAFPLAFLVFEARTPRA